MATFHKRTWVNGNQPYMNADNLNELEGDIQTFGNAVKTETLQEVEGMNLGGLPIGAGCDYFGTILPSSDYMWADGSAISRTTYAELFAIMGTVYGVGDGSTTFNLPDKRERITVMYKEGSTMGTTGATFGTMGAMGGEDTHTLVTNEIPSHTHTILGKNGSGGSAKFLGAFNIESVNWSTNVTSNATGGGLAHNNLQPYLVCNYIIKVK